MSVNLLKKERIEYMENRLSIAAGKSAHALSQMLHCRVDVNLSAVHLSDLPGLPAVIENPNAQVVGVRMNMFGDIKGAVFFMLFDTDKERLMRLINDATFGEGSGVGLDISILEEVGNITAGVYLTTIAGISGLNIYHSIPYVAMDMFSSLLDETIAREGTAGYHLVMIENLFTVTKESIKTFLLLIPSSDCVSVFLDAINNAEETQRN